MPEFFSRYATPLTTGLFLVSLISGVALFFHLGSSLFHAMHEWLSMVLIVPFVLHIWKNWRAFVTYFKHAPMTIALLLSLAGGLAFAIPASLSETGSPQRAVFGAMSNGSLTHIAPLFGYEPDALAAALREKGLDVAGPETSVKAIAEASGESPFHVIAVIGSLKN